MIAFLNLIDMQGNKDKFTELYDLYKNLLYWIAFQKVNNPEDAEECVQETFFYVAKNFDKIDDVNSNQTKCYLSTIVTGFAIDIYNNSKKVEFVANDDGYDFNAESSNSFCNDQYDKIELLSVFDSVLDEESKILFYLKYIYGYKSNEIAKLYNVNASYIRKKLQYSRAKLKKYLERGDL